MPLTADRVVVELEARLQSYLSNLALAEKRFDSTMRNIEGRANRGSRQVGNALGGLGGLFKVGATLYIAKQIANYADAWVQAGRALQSTEQFFGVRVRSLKQLADLAIETRSDLQSIVTLYNRTAVATRGLGVAEEDVFRVTKTVAEAMKLGGASASEQASTLLQLSQAFQKGKLDGDEFRTVMENASVIQEALIKKLGITKSQLYSMSQAGKITVKDLIEALKDIGPEVDKAFKSSQSTIGEATTNMGTAITALIGNFSEASGVGNALADTINDIAAAMVNLANSNALADFGQSLQDFVVQAGVFVTSGRLVSDSLVHTARRRRQLQDKGFQFTDAANDPATLRSRLEALAHPKAQTSTATAGAAKKSAFDTGVAGIREQIENLDLERKLLGASTAEITRRQTALKLEQDAVAAGIPITKTRREQIEQMSTQLGIQTELLEKARLAQEHMDAAAQESFDAVRQGFADVILGAKSFKDALGDILEQFAKIAINSAFTNLFQPGKAGGAGGGFFDLLGQIFTGGHAHGGTIPRGGFGTASENETVVAGRDGAIIIPNGSASRGSGGASITFAPTTILQGVGSGGLSAAEATRLLDQRDRQWKEALPGMISQAHGDRLV